MKDSTRQVSDPPVTIRRTDTVGFVSARYPDTQEVFDWYDIDPEFDGRTTLDEISDELGVDVDHMIEQLTEVADAYEAFEPWDE